MEKIHKLTGWTEDCGTFVIIGMFDYLVSMYVF